MLAPRKLRLAVLALALGALVAPATALADDGWLRTDGPLLRDVAGRQVLLTGAQSVGGVSDTSISLLEAAGFNAMRFTVPWQRIEGTAPQLVGGGLQHTWSDGWLKGMDAQIKRLTDAHIRVIIEMHQSQWSSAFSRVAIGMPPWLYPGAHANETDEGKARVRFFKNQNWPGFSRGGYGPQDLLIEAMQMLANRYKDNSWVVGFDMLNEPGWPDVDPGGVGLPTGGDLLAFFARAARALHQVNPRLLTIYESGTFAQAAYRGGTMIQPSSGGLREPNSVLSWHYYPAAPMSTRQWSLLLDQYEMARTFNQPLWIGEFNAYEQARDPAKAHVFGAAWRPLTLDLMAWTKAHDVGWNLWAFQRGAGATLMTAGNGLKFDIINVLRTGMK